MSVTTRNSSTPLSTTLRSAHVPDHLVAVAATRPTDITPNPLWVIVIAMACFFGAAALIVG